MTYLWLIILIVVAPPVLLAGKAQYRATQEYRRWQKQVQNFHRVNAAFLGLGVAAQEAGRAFEEMNRKLNASYDKIADASLFVPPTYGVAQ